VFGCVIQGASRDLSRSHVSVQYRHEPERQFVPLALFATRCYQAIRDGQPLGIDQLLVAPIAKQRHAPFFDRLTDWGPAVTRARKRPSPRSRSLYDG